MSEWLRHKDLNSLITTLEDHKGSLLICIDAQLERLYAAKFQVLKSKTNILWFSFPPGEKSKTYEEWERALEFFLDRGVTRKSHLIAIGGGAISDVAGFVASTLLRGISWSVVPTTLLSQIDASIGGKVAINAKAGKNLIGNFHPPEKIYVCHEFLESMSKKELMSGKGELLKYAFLDKKIAKLLDQNKPLEEIVDACAKYKLDLVAQDLSEKGLRKILNLGHTIGHGIEWVYKIPHGTAVMWGLALIFILEEQTQLLAKWKEYCRKMELDSLVAPWKSSQWNEEAIIENIIKDKKNNELGSVDLIIVKQIGDVTYETRQWKDVIEKMKAKKGEIDALSFD